MIDESRIRNASPSEVEKFLLEKGLFLAPNGHVARIQQGNEFDWINCKAPNDNRELLAFCYTLISCIPFSQRKLLIFNNENGFQDIEDYRFNRLIYGTSAKFRQPVDKAIIFFEENKFDYSICDIVLADSISMILAQEGHAELVVDASDKGEYIGIQDGFIYFNIRENKIQDTSSIINSWKLNRKIYPDWILNLR